MNTECKSIAYNTKADRCGQYHCLWIIVSQDVYWIITVSGTFCN